MRRWKQDGDPERGRGESKVLMAEGGERTSKAAEDGVVVTGATAATAVATATAAAPVSETGDGGVTAPVSKQEQPQVEYSVDDLLTQHRELIESMLAEGILDDQFSQLQMLQDESTPDFVEEVVTLFFDDSEKLLENLTESLTKDPIDYKGVDNYVHQFKGSSSSIGAQRIKKVCMTFRPCCDKKDKQGCLDHLVKVKEEFDTVRTKLGEMLTLEKQIVAAGGQLPFMEC